MAHTTPPVSSKWPGAMFLGAEQIPAYTLRRDVAIFQSEDPDDSTRVDQLDSMVERALRVGWLQAARETYAHNPNMERYITDQSRHGYLGLVPITAESRVLEIGCALGQCTTLLAPKCKVMVAMDVVRGQAEYTKVRCAEAGLSNVHVAVGGHDGALPFRDACFDVVILNLVLEWCGSRTSADHDVTQRRLLSEIARVLNRGGTLWLSTKNRFAMRLLLGGCDEHMSGMRFGSCLPGFVSGAILRARGISRSRGLLHSHTQLKRMLLDSGFSRCEAALGLPEARYAEQFVLADSPTFRALRAEGRVKLGSGRFVSRIMRVVPSKLVKHVAWGNAFVATK
jgi:SAM-dependent methyltransferase